MYFSTLKRDLSFPNWYRVKLTGLVHKLLKYKTKIPTDLENLTDHVVAFKLHVYEDVKKKVEELIN